MQCIVVKSNEFENSSPLIYFPWILIMLLLTPYGRSAAITLWLIITESIFMSRVEGSMSRVEGTMSRVEGNNVFNCFLFCFVVFFFMENKWKTNKKNLKNKWWRVEISIHISSTCWVRERGGGEHNTLLDNRFLNMSDCLRTSSAQRSHHIVKNVVKKVLKTDLTDVLLSKWAWPPVEAGITN